ncbi:butyrate kinase [Pelotomaculum terephthalicicum JT]|uniref:butyrate kinase n=1 Tax=Pelotomaculum TaxID=191373 RepID=UPI0009D4DDB3|nr:MULTISPECIES: butyrate kinase [Pelotomaculum]MCG9968014.1 butyrate kinase [Pelotomaculum terephthalicicum JT]OPX88867.1 MAG: Butyrate kinase 2 [Pelotomaculum sp. PtaB.Bin117]OPY60809.1 MAG: Butyrate kinase 2 [Pelotomaculum sp. PtaU1.Bin065]
MKSFLQLIINPGSTSTKLAVFRDNDPIFSETLRHGGEELKKFPGVTGQFAYRRRLVIDAIAKSGVKPGELDAVVGRGGLLRPVPGGTYLVNKEMLEDLEAERRGSHASNLGGLIAHSIAGELGIPAYIVDPVCIDEKEPVSRISGMPENPRESLFHALNQKAVARRAAEDMGKNYSEINLVVAHLGGGISVGAHLRGRVIDVNDALAGDGPFTPERSGGLPAGKLVEMCYSGLYTRKEMMKKIVGGGGLVAYLGTADALEVEERIERGDEQAKLIYEAMAYQVAKEIGACGAILKGDVDAVVITGGIAHSRMLVGWIEERVRFIAPVRVYPGENEMEALAAGGLRVLAGLEDVKVY